MLYTVVWPVISACGVHVYETYTHILLHSDYCNFRLSPPVEWHLRMDTLYKVGGKCQSVHVENGHQNWNTTHSLHNVSHFTLSCVQECIAIEFQEIGIVESMSGRQGNISVTGTVETEPTFHFYSSESPNLISIPTHGYCFSDGFCCRKDAQNM